MRSSGHKENIKVGTESHALRDFHSLRPTSVLENGDQITGQVGNQVITLVQQNLHRSGYPHLGLWVGNAEYARDFGIPRANRIERLVVYFDDYNDADRLLRHYENSIL